MQPHLPPCTSLEPVQLPTQERQTDTHGAELRYAQGGRAADVWSLAATFFYAALWQRVFKDTNVHVCAQCLVSITTTLPAGATLCITREACYNA